VKIIFKEENDIVFIDESGDPGIQKISETNRYFTMAMIVFHSDRDVSAADIMIGNLRKNIAYDKEFHFCKTRDAIKDKFFALVKNMNFEISVLTVNKDSIHNEYMKNNPLSFYDYILKQLITNSHLKLQKPIVFVDGDKSKKYTNKLVKYLRKSNFELKKLKFLNSKNSNLIQLADMVVSCLQYSIKHSEKDNWKPWLATIKTKIKPGCNWNFK
jgi:hypothetical protein